MDKRTTGEVIQKVEESYITQPDKYRNYANSVTINGFLINRPRKFVTDGGKEMRIFSLVQIEKNKSTKFFSCQTFAKSVIEELDSLECATLVNALGMISSQKTGKLKLKIEEVSCTHSFEDIPLLDAYEYGQSKEY